MKLRDLRRIEHRSIPSWNAVIYAADVSGITILDSTDTSVVLLGTQEEIRFYTKFFSPNAEISHLAQFEQGVRFYALYKNTTLKHKDNAFELRYSTGNVLAVFWKEYNEQLFGGQDFPNAVLPQSKEAMPNTTWLKTEPVPFDFIARYGKTISVESAVKLHPALFASGMLNHYDAKKLERVQV